MNEREEQLERALKAVLELIHNPDQTDDFTKAMTLKAAESLLDKETPETR